MPLIDNRFGGFPRLESFGRRRVTFSETLIEIASSGCHVVVATSDDRKNDPINANLRMLALKERVNDLVTLCTVPSAERMHSKALAGDDFVIAGSMNFTYRGVMLNEEQVQFHTDPAYVAATQREMYERFGGVLE